MVLVYVSSALRRRIGVRAWRRLHWLTYAVFALATLHGLAELADDLIAVARVGETDDEAAVEAASACPMGAIRLVEVRPDTTRRAA
jgi:methionine sulfoxide reductase heme-binding subunit